MSIEPEVTRIMTTDTIEGDPVAMDVMFGLIKLLVKGIVLTDELGIEQVVQMTTTVIAQLFMLEPEYLYRLCLQSGVVTLDNPTGPQVLDFMRQLEDQLR